MAYSITVSHNAETGHRIPVLEGPGAKCRNVHGHSFQIEWTFLVDDPNAEGGAEFGAIKKVLRGYVDEKMDHGFACRYDDPIGKHLEYQGLKVLFLPTYPTTEALAKHLFDVAESRLPHQKVLKVAIQEGKNNQAAYYSERWSV